LAVAALTLLATALACTAAWVYRHQSHRAEEARTQAEDRLRDSLVEQAQVWRWTGQAGQRARSLEALEAAAALRHSPEDRMRMRNLAVECMALADLIPGQLWDAAPGGTTGLAFDAVYQRYARAARDGTLSVRRVRDDEELHRLSGIAAARTL